MKFDTKEGQQLFLSSTLHFGIVVRLGKFVISNSEKKLYNALFFEIMNLRKLLSWMINVFFYIRRLIEELS